MYVWRLSVYRERDLVHDVRAAETGGALQIYTVDSDPVNTEYCMTVNPTPLPVYRQWTKNTSTLISGCVFEGNAANCSTCSGGAIAQGTGGSIVLWNTVVRYNSAGFFGGGLYLGEVGLGASSCDVSVAGGLIGGNTAGKGGAQIYSSCGGNVTFDSATVQLEARALEVRPRSLS